MSNSHRGSRSLTLAVALTSVIVCLGRLAGQQTEPATSPSPSVSPTSVVRTTPSPTPDVGAQNFHKWGSITIFNGLPSDAVHAIAQTPDGIMWFGTDNGLARFDGRRVERISLGDEASNHVEALAVSETDLWIATQNGAFIAREGSVHSVSGTQSVEIT